MYVGCWGEDKRCDRTVSELPLASLIGKWLEKWKILNAFTVHTALTIIEGINPPPSPKRKVPAHS